MAWAFLMGSPAVSLASAGGANCVTTGHKMANPSPPPQITFNKLTAGGARAKGALPHLQAQGAEANH